MIETIEHSNILDVKSGIICHQVNCIGVMGSGFALQIKNKWPIVFEKYQEDCSVFKSSPELMLGHVLDVLVEPNLVVANCFGQTYPNRCVTMTEYPAWDIILEKLKDLSTFFSLDLHFPYMIGCGLAGGDWNVMSEKIERKFGESQTNAFIHKL